MYDDTEIRSLFRLQRCHIVSIVHDVLPHLEVGSGIGRSFAPLPQVFIALWLYTTRWLQLSLGAWINIHQTTASRTVWTVTLALLRTYPESFSMRVSSKEGFFQKFNIPNIIGCIDYTHLRIPAPPIYQHPDEYINQKQYHSINVQVISDCNCIVTDLDVSWPGSVHDSRIFKNSDVYKKVMMGELNGILLGDNGYGITPFLLTPFLTPNTPAKRNYNHIHKRARCTIERTLVKLRRFHCIGGTLRCKLDRVPSVIAVAFFVYNLAKHVGESDFEGDDWGRWRWGFPKYNRPKW